jgi:hypothetical protein
VLVLVLVLVLHPSESIQVDCLSQGTVNHIAWDKTSNSCHGRLSSTSTRTNRTTRLEVVSTF